MSAKTESFDDRKLINLARYNFYAHKTIDRPEGIQHLFSKEVLNNTERNKLLEFLETSKVSKPVSILDMKQEIFNIIGYESKNRWGTTVNRVELEAILQWIRSKT